MCWHAWDLDRRKNIVPCLNDLWDCVHGISRSHPRASPPIWLTGQSPAWKGLLLQKSSTFWPWDVLKGIPQNIGVVGLGHHLLWCKRKFVCMCAVYILHIKIHHIRSHSITYAYTLHTSRYEDTAYECLCAWFYMWFCLGMFPYTWYNRKGMSHFIYLKRHLKLAKVADLALACNLRGRSFQESVQSKSQASQKASIWVLPPFHLQKLIDQNPFVKFFAVNSKMFVALLARMAQAA